MSNVILYANGTGENHGCEAITVSTINILKNIFDKFYCTTTNLRYDKQEESAIPKSSHCELVEYYYYRKKSLFNLLISKIERVILKTNRFYTSKAWLTKYKNILPQCDVAMSVGGDNYCNYDLEWLYESHRLAIEAGLKTVLWGASVENKCLVDERMRDDLSKFDLIIARESLSYENLKEINDNVYLFPDPAFTLDSEYVSVPFKEGERIVGINLSPTIMDRERHKGMTQRNYEELIRYILTETEYSIALIPHVTFNKVNCDYEVLYPFYQKYKHTGRIYMIEDMNCKKLKFVISKCDFLVTARTHASIAGYSTGVPTLVVGYSIKADGIAHDIFGSSEHYVINRNDFYDSTNLIEAFKWLEANEQYIRTHLSNVMDSYIKKAYSACEVVKELIR